MRKAYALESSNSMDGHRTSLHASSICPSPILLVVFTMVEFWQIIEGLSILPITIIDGHSTLLENNTKLISIMRHDFYMENPRKNHEHQPTIFTIIEKVTTYVVQSVVSLLLYDYMIYIRRLNRL